MRRREFIAGLGGVAAWSVGLRAAQAQQPAIPVVGYLNAGSANTSGGLEPFLQGLTESGLCRRPKCKHRISLGGRTVRAPAQQRGD